MEKYEIIGIVGEGTYGKVLKAFNKETGEFCAIKKFKHTGSNNTAQKTANREIRILKMLKHPNIVTLQEVILVNKKINLVFEFVESTVLEEIQKNPQGMEVAKAKSLILQLLQALSHCHMLGVVHRDIKPENLLVSSSGVLKLCDFGFARTFKKTQKLTEYVSTRWYRAPELLVGGKSYGFPVDVWALGCIAIELLTGNPLFPGFNDADTLLRIVKLCGNLSDNLSKEFLSNEYFEGIELPKSTQRSFDNKFKRLNSQVLDFVKSCIQIEASERPTVSELIGHAMFEAKGKLGISPSATPEQNSYMKIYQRKRSPKNLPTSKFIEESIRTNKRMNFSNKPHKKSYFLPDICRKDESIVRKKSSKHIKKVLEIKTDPKSTLRPPGPDERHRGSRSPSLVHDNSRDSFVKAGFANPVLSNRNHSFVRKDLTPELPSVSVLPNRSRFRRYEDSKNMNSGHFTSSISSFTPYTLQRN